MTASPRSSPCSAPHIEDERHFEELLWQHCARCMPPTNNPGHRTCRMTRMIRTSRSARQAPPTSSSGCTPRLPGDARRAAVPTLVFNLHAQFEELRASGAFPRMRDLIRARDEALQGQVNPMVSDHGQHPRPASTPAGRSARTGEPPSRQAPRRLATSRMMPTRTRRRVPREPPRAADRHRVPTQAGDLLTVVDPTGGQVSDFFALSAANHGSGCPQVAASTTPVRSTSAPATCSTATAADRWPPSWPTPAGFTTSC